MHDSWKELEARTTKAHPGDVDVCWAVAGVKPDQLKPVFWDFSRSQAAQKARFLGECFPSSLPECLIGKTFLDFFPTENETGTAKGILTLNLRRWRL